MSALVRITTGIMPQHSRVGMTRAMAQFGEVIHCHKPPYSGIPGEDFVNVRFGSQDAADRAYASLKANQVFVDGFPVGVGPTPGGGGGGGGKGGGKGKGGGNLALGDGIRQRRSVSPPRHYARNRQRSPYNARRRSPPRRGPQDEPRANFPSRGDAKSASPRRMAREMQMRGSTRRRSRTRSRSPPEQRYRRPAYQYEQERRTDFSIAPGPTMAALPPRRPSPKPVREASPDPPGPVKNPAPVKNPFFKQDRSPTPEPYDPNGDGY